MSRGAGKGGRLAGRIAAANPQATIKQGSRHYVVMVSGRIVGILPLRPYKEGLSANLRSQLRRAGLTIPRGTL